MTIGGERKAVPHHTGERPAPAAAGGRRGDPVAAEVQLVKGKTLLGSARGHRVHTDRPRESGGCDRGFTSGELLLVAIGSCVVGNLNNFLTARGEATAGLTATVSFDVPTDGETFGRILVEARIPGLARPERRAELAGVALSGRVTRRVRAGSEIVVDVIDDKDAAKRST